MRMSCTASFLKSTADRSVYPVCPTGFSFLRYNEDMSRRKRRRRRLRKSLYPAVLILLISCLAVGLVSCLTRKKDEPLLIEPTTVSTLPMHNYDFFHLSIENGVAHYEDDNYVSQFGIDVSEHNKAVDWHVMKNAGVQFAYIRAGYRGYTEGILHEDAYFRTNMEGAGNLGITTGVYFFSQAVSVEEAVEEAAFVLDLIKGYDISLPIVYDFEPYSPEMGARTNNLSQMQRTENAIAFLETIKNAGYEGMLYASAYTYMNLFNAYALTDYPLWVAHYASLPDYPYDFCMWQYSESGNANGIPAGIDLNIAFVPKS